MKINQLGSSTINPYKRQQNKLDSVSTTTHKKTTDKVEISSTAKELLQTLQPQQERRVKLDKIKLDIETGNYSIDSKKVAKSVIDFFSKN